MSDDWRFMRAETPHAGPSNAGAWYRPSESWRDEFTKRPNSGENGPWIEDVRKQIMNQHPEDISALADQWHNAWRLMFDVEQSLLQTSNTLYEKDWKEGDARDAFMRAGPGKTLAYLRSWMNSALDNVAALRAQVNIVQGARSKMDDLWRRYQDAVKAASETDGTFGNWLWNYNFNWRGDQTNYENANKADAVQQVNDTKKEYARLAQQLAWDTAEQMSTTFGNLNNGHGLPFFPMNALLTPIGQPNPPALGGPPGTPAGLPGGANLPPNLKSLANLPPDLKSLANLPPDLKSLDNLPDQPNVNLVQPVTDPIPPPALPVTNLAKPSPMPPPVLPPGLPTTPKSAPAPVKAPSWLTKLSADTTDLSSGLIQAKGALTAQPEVTPGTLRSPGAAPPPPMTSQMKGRPTRTDPTQREGAVRQTGTDESFGRTPASTSPPVLNNQRPGKQRRADRRDEFDPATYTSPGSSAPMRPAGATPPVLSSPGKNAMHAPPAPAPTRPRSGALAAQGQSGRPAPPGDWVGVNEARVDVAASVVEAPSSPPSGTAVSNLDEIKLRGRASGAPTVSPELPARRAHHDTFGAGAPATDMEEAGQRIVTDEQAFSVDSPGGGVLTKRPDGRTYRVEPPTALSGGG
jgi:hypothetical protein